MGEIRSKRCQTGEVFVFKLATCAEYRVDASTFGLSQITVRFCIYSTCQAIKAKLMCQYITLPDLAEAQEVVDRSYSLHHVPQVNGAPEVTYIPIPPPAAGYRDYVNQKGWPSIV